MNVLDQLLSLRSRALGIARRLDWLPLLLLRLSLAATFVPTGWGKIHDLGKVTAYFVELGIPAPHLNAVVVSITELVCGSLLLVGLFSRLAAVPLVVSMTVAIITAKWPDLHGVADLFSVDEFVYVVMLVGVIVLGPGAVSLDGQLARRMKWPVVEPY